VSEESGLVYVSRVVRLPLITHDGAPLGRIVDVILAPPYRGEPPRVTGLVANVQRRRIFVNGGRIASITSGGVELRKGSVDLRHFEARTGEMLAAQLIGRRLDHEIVQDIGLREVEGRAWQWEVATVATRVPGPIRRRRRSTIAPWTEYATLFDVGPGGREVAAMRELHPADLAAQLRMMPLERRRLIATAMDDDRLADVLEELDEDEQLSLVAELDLGRLADVLEEMEPDDAADLLAEMPGALRVEILDRMEPDEAAPVRRLLQYGDDTAGGLMTPEPIIATVDVTVADALAQVRRVDLPATLAAQVFVVDPPIITPTGIYRGVVGFQRLLREPPSSRLLDCLDDSIAPISPELPEGAVAQRLATYDLFAIPVCDDAGRLLGAVTVDDVLDHALPDGWRDAK
jgi:CBS domain-containing protein